LYSETSVHDYEIFRKVHNYFKMIVAYFEVLS